MKSRFDFAIGYEGGTFYTFLMLDERPQIGETMEFELEGNIRPVTITDILEPVVYEGVPRTPVCGTVMANKIDHLSATVVANKIVYLSAHERTIDRPDESFFAVATTEDGKSAEGTRFKTTTELLDAFQKAGFGSIPNTGERFEFDEHKLSILGIDSSKLK